MRISCSRMKIGLDTDDDVLVLRPRDGLSATLCLGDSEVTTSRRQTTALLRELIEALPNEAHELLAQYDDDVLALKEYDDTLAAARAREGEEAVSNV